MPAPRLGRTAFNLRYLIRELRTNLITAHQQFGVALEALDKLDGYLTDLDALESSPQGTHEAANGDD